MNESDDDRSIFNTSPESETQSSTSDSSNPNQEKQLTILDGKYFRVKETRNSTVVASCVLCPPGTEIRGFKTTTTNFVSHLKRRHGDDIVKQYHEHLKRKREKIKNSTVPVRKTEPVRRKIIDDDLVLKFIIDSMVPLRTVDNKYFKKICEAQNASCSRRTLSRKITSLFEKCEKVLIDVCDNNEYLCTTCDIWSSKKRSFLGITIHWIDFDTLTRKSAALACRRFKGVHSADRIATLLTEIHGKYKIDGKIVATVTDNASNFIKAFSQFGIKSSSMCFRRAEEEEEGNGDTRISIDEAENVEDNVDDDVDELEPESDDTLFSTLPRHLRCASHTLNLSLSGDILKSIAASPELKKIHDTVMKKCNRLWRSANRPKSAEIIHNILGHTLSRPGVTRWNSLYDCWNQILTIRTKCNELFLALNIKNALTSSEFDYITEHLKVTKSAANLLDILQGEKNIYYGIMLPSLISLDRKMVQLKLETWTYCQPILEALHTSIKKRFAQFYEFSTGESYSAAIAAFSYPRFKQRWVQSDTIDKHYREYLLTAFKDAVYKENPDAHSEKPSSPTLVDDEFFDFGTANVQQPQQCNKLDDELRQYFDDPTNTIECLDRYPAIKRVFIKYNTPLPSSAPVERLFSFATMVDAPRCNKLSDEMFEYRVVLKANMDLL